jgi:mitochondrial fission protein ELM1
VSGGQACARRDCAAPFAGDAVTAPAIWVVSDGRAGIERQALSLARAVHDRSPGPLATLRLAPRGLQVSLPPDMWPTPLAALPADQRASLRAPWPDVWIGSGRRSIPYSRQVKRWSAGRTLVVQTQDPRVNLAPFDLVVPPAHDCVAPAHNVFPILGPPTWWSAGDIAAAQSAFPALARDARRKLLVSIGGDSKTHKLTVAAAARIEAALRAAANDHALWISVSRRTPEPARARLRALAADLGAIFWETPDRDGPNPYLAWLSLCDAALVTEDSANLLADPAFFAKPIHLLRLEGRSDRFDRLHADFIDRGAARWFDGRIEAWTYAPIREAERAAAEILRLLAGRRPA